jgi:DNA-binding NarL/FixJ family response regulator
MTALPSEPALRVVIADDHFLVREGVRRLLESSGEVTVVAVAENAAELLTLVADLAVDAVMTDIRMPPGHHMEGIEAAHRIRERHPGVGVVVLSQHADESYAYELLKHGTAGLAYLLKDRVGDVDELVRALREVANGRSAIDARVVDALVQRKTRRAASGLDGLTPRELDVLREMAQGKSNPGIAASLVLSESAVEKHVSSILSKLDRADERGLHRRVAAVLAFLQDRDERS